MPRLFIKSIWLTAMIVALMAAANWILLNMQKSEFATQWFIFIGIVVALALIGFGFIAIRQNSKPTHNS